MDTLLFHNGLCHPDPMKKSLIIVILLAAIAGATGVAVIGFAVARAPPRGQEFAQRTARSDGRGNAAFERCSARTPAASRRVIRFAKDPAPTPPFLVTDVDGKSVSTVQLRGKIIIVNFWATWCPPCRAEIPELIALQNKYKDQLEIIGVSMDDDASPAQVKAFAAKAGINYPIVMGAEIAKEYGGVPALPTSFVVNKDGGIVQKHVGMLQPEEIETEVRALLGMPISAKIETFIDTWARYS